MIAYGEKSCFFCLVVFKKIKQADVSYFNFFFLLLQNQTYISLAFAFLLLLLFTDLFSPSLSLLPSSFWTLWCMEFLRRVQYGCFSGYDFFSCIQKWRRDLRFERLCKSRNSETILFLLLCILYVYSLPARIICVSAQCSNVPIVQFLLV